MPADTDTRGTPVQRPIRDDAGEIVGHTDGYVVEIRGRGLLVEGPGADDFVAWLHAELDAGRDPEVSILGGTGHPAPLRLRVVRSPEVRTATLRIEGRG